MFFATVFVLSLLNFGPSITGYRKSTFSLNKLLFISKKNYIAHIKDFCVFSGRFSPYILLIKLKTVHSIGNSASIRTVLVNKFFCLECEAWSLTACCQHRKMTGWEKVQPLLRDIYGLLVEQTTVIVFQIHLQLVRAKKPCPAPLLGQ